MKCTCSPKLHRACPACEERGWIDLKRSVLIVLAALLLVLLFGCGGGDPEPEDHPPVHPCKINPRLCAI